MLKTVKQAKKDKNISKYGVDQNGRITVKVKATSKWVEVSSSLDLESSITSTK